MNKIEEKNRTYYENIDWVERSWRVKELSTTTDYETACRAEAYFRLAVAGIFNHFGVYTAHNGISGHLQNISSNFIERCLKAAIEDGHKDAKELLEQYMGEGIKNT